MAKKSISSRPGLSKWLHPKTYFDRWFALLERVRSAMWPILDHGYLFNDRSSRRRRPSFLPQIEGLEMRLLMTNVGFLTSAQQVNYNATAIVEVDLSGSSAQTITVNYTSADGSATAGVDYTAVSGSLTYQPGATSKTFSMPMLNHRETSNTNFSLTLSSPVNASLGTTTDTVTIIDLPSQVVDAATNIALPQNTPINTFSNWQMSLRAQNAGAAVSAYSWNFSNASDAGSVSGTSTYNATFTWGSFTGAARTDTITLTETGSGGGLITQTFTFQVTADDSKAYVANANQPTSSSTWPTVLAPDQLMGQDTVAAGPYAVVGLADGSAQTSFTLPSYNPNDTPLDLVYNSAVAHPDPVFMETFQLSATSALPTTITAQLTITDQSNNVDYTGSVVYYSPSLLNKGDYAEIALQAATMGSEPTGRYNWQIVTTLTYSPTVITTYAGAFNFINGSTTPTSTTNSPFGAGWSLDGVARLWPVTGGAHPGVILQNPDGTSLWFAGSGATYTSPPGVFASLSLSGGTYTLTQADGTTVNFNSTGQQITIVDANTNTTTFGYDSTSGALISVTDATALTNTITYNVGGGSAGLAATIADPTGRTLTLTYTSGNLTGITDPNSNAWTYGYDASNRLTSLKDPRSTGTNYKTSFTYNFASQVSSVTQPDGTSQSFSAVQLTGLATSGTGTSGNPAKARLNADARATYTDPNGQTWTEYLDSLGFGQPVEAVDPLGDTSLTYRDAQDRPWLIADPLGRRDRLFYDISDGTLAYGDVATLVNADDSYTVSTYNTTVNYTEPLWVTDPTGGITTYTYDSSGNLLTVEDSLSNTTSYAYTNGNHVKGLLYTHTEPLNASFPSLHVTTYAYDSADRMTTMTQAVTTGVYVNSVWTYDSYSDMATYTDPDGNVTSYTYDYLGNMLTQVVPQGTGVVATYTYTYDSVGNLTTVVTPFTTTVTATTSYAYDAMNRLTKTTDPLSNVTTYLYDSAGNSTGETNALGYTTTNVLDAAGRTIAVQVPIAAGTTATTTYTLDADGEATAVTNPLSQTTTYAYNSRGWVSKVTTPLGDSVTYSYDAAGDQTGATQKDTGSNKIITTATYYNATGLVNTTTDALGDLTTYSYDANNNPVTVQGVNQKITYSYDGLNHELTQSYGDSATNTNSLDNNGLVLNSTGPTGNITTYTYDKQGRSLTTVTGVGTMTSTATTVYTYDLAGRQTWVTDPNGNTTTYAYNADDWLTTVTNPNGYTATYAYDNIGELTAMTDYAGRQTTYSYNRAGWQTGETWVGGSYTATYTYNNAGQMTVAKDSFSTYSYTYDNNQQLTQTKVSYAGASGMGTVTLNYGYDGFGNRTSLSDSSGAVSTGTTTYTYNSNFQMTALNFTEKTTTLTLATANVGFTYGNTYDSLSTMTMGGGGDTITAAYGYNGAVSINYSDTSSNPLATFSYSLGESTAIYTYTGPQGSAGFTNGTLTYTYDKSGQLIGVGGGESFTYSFDNNGNRTTSVGTTTTTYGTTTGNEMNSAGSFSYTYDANGNLATMFDPAGHTVTYTYTWDYRNRLTQVVATGTTSFTENLSYDIFNNLIGVSVNGTQQRWTVYDGKNPYIDFDGTGSLATRYLTNPQGQNQFYGQVSSGGTIEWYVTDLTGSIREVVSGSGTVLDQVNYDPFGNIIFQSSLTYEPRFLFDGGEYDSNLGLYRFNDRWQDPVSGRWISQDPIGFSAGDSNLYRYVNNAPINQIDPTGCFPVLIAGDACGVYAIIGQLQNQKILGMKNVGDVPAKGPYTLAAAAKQMWSTRWTLKEKKSGFIIQHVVGTVKSKGKPVSQDYYEAWQVVNGVIYGGYAWNQPGNIIEAAAAAMSMAPFGQGALTAAGLMLPDGTPSGTDTFNPGFLFLNTVEVGGSFSITGNATFVEGTSLAWKPGGVPNAGSLQGERIKLHPNYCLALDFDKCTRLRFSSELSLHGGESWALPRFL